MDSECDSLSTFFEESDFGTETNLVSVASPENIFSILEALEGVSESFPLTPLEEPNLCSKGVVVAPTTVERRLVSQQSTSSSAPQDSKAELEASPKCKRQQHTASAALEEANQDGQQRTSHITVERNRRKQMSENLLALRSLMPSFYVKRGDQASIIGGVVDYINELQQVLQSLETKKQRKLYSEVLSPRFVSSPRPPPLSPRKPPLSPRLSLPISPRTPQPSSPYKPRFQQVYVSPTMNASHESSPPSSTPSIDIVNDLVTNSKSAIADVEVRFSGPNVLLKTTSPRIPGQAAKIISALDDLSLEILQVNITTMNETMVLSFTIKIGIECQLSAEELAHQIQQTFC
ncbi:unnamed protein product [Ilex paraguariensis]|uniref:BHLH domain-containing protein n=1 Tax=Ilex paraguariensis TaxID=185542 RepID=A0ABC8UDB5_9AQUA